MTECIRCLGRRHQSPPIYDAPSGALLSLSSFCVVVFSLLIRAEYHEAKCIEKRNYMFLSSALVALSALLLDGPYRSRIDAIQTRRRSQRAALLAACVPPVPRAVFPPAPPPSLSPPPVCLLPLPPLAVAWLSLSPNASASPAFPSRPIDDDQLKLRPWLGATALFVAMELSLCDGLTQPRPPS